ncbi:MAG: NAD-dependent epimerase/dehydratase family protein [Sulfuricellaceae bacterium]
MKVLVIGGAGFIGSNVVKELLLSGHAVRLYTRPTQSLGRLADQMEKVEVVHGDFMDDHAVSETLQGVDAVVHSLSTTFPKTVLQSAAYDVMSNLLPTMRLVDHCLKMGIHNLTYLSSGGTVYGEAEYVPIDEDHPRNPISLYGLSKLTIENYLRFISNVQPLSIKILRVSNPYGPSQNFFGVQGIVGVALGCLLHHRPFTIFGDGQNVRDYIHVVDVAHAVRLAVEHTANLTVNIGTGMGTTITGLLEQIELATGRTLDKVFLPDRGIDVRQNILDNRLAKEALGWTPRYSLSEGLQEVAASAMSLGKH